MVWLPFLLESISSWEMNKGDHFHIFSEYLIGSFNKVLPNLSLVLILKSMRKREEKKICKAIMKRTGGRVFPLISFKSNLLKSSCIIWSVLCVYVFGDGDPIFLYKVSEEYKNLCKAENTAGYRVSHKLGFCKVKVWNRFDFLEITSWNILSTKYVFFFGTHYLCY